MTTIDSAVGHEAPRDREAALSSAVESGYASAVERLEACGADLEASASSASQTLSDADVRALVEEGREATEWMLRSVSGKGLQFSGDLVELVEAHIAYPWDMSQARHNVVAYLNMQLERDGLPSLYDVRDNPRRDVTERQVNAIAAAVATRADVLEASTPPARVVHEASRPARVESVEQVAALPEGSTVRVRRPEEMWHRVGREAWMRGTAAGPEFQTNAYIAGAREAYAWSGGKPSQIAPMAERLSAVRDSTPEQAPRTAVRAQWSLPPMAPPASVERGRGHAGD